MAYYAYLILFNKNSSAKSLLVVIIEVARTVFLLFRPPHPKIPYESHKSNPSLSDLSAFCAELFRKKAWHSDIIMVRWKYVSIAA